MPVKEIKQHWIITCDCCGAEKTQTGTHRPSRWVGIKVSQDACDYSGAPVADGSIELVLCTECGSRVVQAMNASANAIRAALTPEPEGEKG